MVPSVTNISYVTPDVAGPINRAVQALNALPGRVGNAIRNASDTLYNATHDDLGNTLHDMKVSNSPTDFLEGGAEEYE